MAKSQDDNKSQAKTEIAKLDEKIEEKKVKMADLDKEIADREEELKGLQVPGGAKVSIKGPSAKIVGHGGVIIRTYSEEVHGKNFLDLAKMFVEKNKAKSYKIQK